MRIPPFKHAAFQPKKFTSYDRDSNGTDEAMFRRYNRWQSRFDQPDPYDGSYDATDPQSFNRYAYVQGDPVNFFDPSGLKEEIVPVCPDGNPCPIPFDGGTIYDGGSGISGDLLRFFFTGFYGGGYGGGPRDNPGGGGGGLGGQKTGPNAALGQRFGRKDKEARCKEAIRVATEAMSEIARREGNAISAPGGLDKTHRKSIAQDQTRLSDALSAIDKNCFDGPGGPPLLPELADSINKIREQAVNKLRLPPVGWDGGRSQAENRLRYAVPAF